MSVDTSFFDEEIRCGFKVSVKRKKIWATELRILEKFDEVCKKHNLTYFAEYGTLLGAVRHKGFIPWDDDIDVAMFRDDYQKLQAVAAEEFVEPYFFENAYSASIGGAFSKLRDSRTTAIEYPDQKDLNQGIFIDIYPLDDVPDGTAERTNIFEIQKMMWLTIANAEELMKALGNREEGAQGNSIMRDLLKMEPRQRMKTFELFNLAQFGKSASINFITDEIVNGSKYIKRSWYDHVVYLPFENILMPVPEGYHEILTSRYGDYHEMIQNQSAHEGIIFDPDMPYQKYFT